METAHQKQALVVDHSNLTRGLLETLLAEHGLSVTTAQSAEEALKILSHKTRPDVIFMDHNMKGLDGLQAVKAIKADPGTAMIPLFLYTSKAGEVYAAQARAFGAIGVIPKKLKKIELAKILDKLKLSSTNETSITNSNDINTALAAVEPFEAHSFRSMVKRLIEEMEEQVVSQMEIKHQALKDSVESVLTETCESMQEFSSQYRRSQRIDRHIKILTLLALLLMPALWLFLQMKITHLEPQAPAERPTPALPIVQNHREAPGKLTPSLQPLLNMVEWSINEKNSVAYGSYLFNDEQAQFLEILLENLSAIGFTGNIQAISHLGEFCLANQGGQWIMPDAGLPLSECEIMKLDAIETNQTGQQQSIIFGNLLSSLIGEETGINIQLQTRGTTEPKVAYPSLDAISTAGEWNAIARQNNRVEYRLSPTFAQ